MCTGILGDIGDAIGILPEKTKIPKVADPAIAEAASAKEAAATDLARRRKIAAGGRQTTLLAGRQVAEETQRKSLLGQ